MSNTGARYKFIYSKFYEKVEIKKILMEIKTFNFNESEEYKNTIRTFEINFNKKPDDELDYNMTVLRDDLEKLFLEKNEQKFINVLVFSNIDKSLFNI